MMLGVKVWLTVCATIHPQASQWGFILVFMQASQVHTRLYKPFLYGLGFVHWGIIMLEQKKSPFYRNCLPTEMSWLFTGL